MGRCFRFLVCEITWFWVYAVGSRWLRGEFLLGSQGGLLVLVLDL